MIKKVEKKSMKKKKKSDSKLKNVLEKLNNFFNDPKPIIIVLIAIICLLLIFISRINTKSTIYVGQINENDIQVANVHYFTNNDMNYFYASNALFAGNFADKKVYSYQLGYYVVDKDGEYIEFASRSKEADTPATLAEIVDELSGWSFAESNINSYFFSKEVINNMDNLHFVIRASSKKDSKEADINLDYKVDLSKITK